MRVRMADPFRLVIAKNIEHRRPPSFPHLVQRSVQSMLLTFESRQDNKRLIEGA